MKKNYHKIAALAILAAALSSCSSDDLIPAAGEGTIFLSASISDDIKAQSRTEIDGYQLQSVWIANDKGVLYEYKDLSEIPSGGLPLLAGSYRAHAWVGDSVPASFDSRYFRGAQNFDIAAGDRKSIGIPCNIVNTVVAVSYDPSVTGVLADYTCTVGHSQGELTFIGSDERRGYFMMNSRDKDLEWTLVGTQLNGAPFEKSGRIGACKAATLYTLGFSFKGEDSEIGGAYFNVTVDDEMIQVEDVVTVTAPPAIEGIGFDINTDIRAEAGNVGKKSLWITSSAPLDGIVLSCPYFVDRFGEKEGDFDILRNANEALRQAITDAGIIIEHFDTDTDTGFSQLKLAFGATFTNSLPDGNYPVSVTAIDCNDRRAFATLNIIVSADPVSLIPIADADVWATKATIHASINKSDAANPCIKYRRLGTSAWTVAESTGGKGLDALITGLEPGTTYQCCAATDDFETETLTFTTETPDQMPDSDFESWSEDDKIIVIGASAASKFWDSGNTASAPLMDVNPTSGSTDYKHSGDYSVKLQSQYVGLGILGAFAAGNMFVGEFIRTDGTNGVLGWGRQWDTRPSGLKGWVRYEPKTVDNDKNGDCPLIKKGDMDKGIIYIALLDNSVIEGDSGKSYPVIVKTKKSDRRLFDKDGANVIAYGELIYDAATAGDGMVEFEIPIIYHRTDIKPSYIMCTASASIGGDYFVGGEGSTMYLDDLQLVY